MVSMERVRSTPHEAVPISMGFLVRRQTSFPVRVSVFLLGIDFLADLRISAHLTQ